MFCIQKAIIWYIDMWLIAAALDQPQTSGAQRHALSHQIGLWHAFPLQAGLRFYFSSPCVLGEGLSCIRPAIFVMLAWHARFSARAGTSADSCSSSVIPNSSNHTRTSSAATLCMASNDKIILQTACIHVCQLVRI